MQVTIEERYAVIAAYPMQITTPSLLTPVSYLTAGLFSCTFTSPVTLVPELNDPDGYHVLLARGRFDGDTSIMHSNRCLTGGRIRINRCRKV